MREPRYLLRYFFDAGSGCCLWSANSHALERFGYAVGPEHLGLTADLSDRYRQLCSWFDTSLDWADPTARSPWSEEDERRFGAAATDMLRDLSQELGSEFFIADERGIQSRAADMPNGTKR